MLFATLCYTFDVTLFTTLFNRTFLHFPTLSLYTFGATFLLPFTTLFVRFFTMLFCYTFVTLLVLHFFASLCYTFCYTLLQICATIFYYVLLHFWFAFLLHLSLHFWYYTYLLHFALPVALAYTFSTLFSTLCTTILYICTPQICIHFALPFNILCHINRPCNSSLSHWQDGTVFAICTGLYRSIGLWPLCKNYCFTDVVLD